MLASWSQVKYEPSPKGGGNNQRIDGRQTWSKTTIGNLQSCTASSWNAKSILSIWWTLLCSCICWNISETEMPRGWSQQKHTGGCWQWSGSVYHILLPRIHLLSDFWRLHYCCTNTTIQTTLTAAGDFLESLPTLWKSHVIIQWGEKCRTRDVRSITLRCCVTRSFCFNLAPYTLA